MLEQLVFLLGEEKKKTTTLSMIVMETSDFVFKGSH